MAVSGPPASRARSARGIVRPPSVARADRGHRALRGRPPPRRALPALPRAARCSSSSTPDAVAERADAALVAYPHKAAAPAVKALRERGLKVVDLSADFRLDREPLRALVPAARGARAARRGRVRPDRDAPGGDRGGRPGAAPGLQLHRGAAGAAAARAGAIDDAMVDIKGGVSGAGREATEDDALRLGRRERERLQGRGPPPQRELEQELGAGAASRFVPHLLPLDQGLLASCYVTGRGARRRTRCGRCSRTHTPTSRSWSVVD